MSEMSKNDVSFLIIFDRLGPFGTTLDQFPACWSSKRSENGPNWHKSCSFSAVRAYLDLILGGI